jgi:hypothetical protein
MKPTSSRLPPLTLPGGEWRCHWLRRLGKASSAALAAVARHRGAKYASTHTHAGLHATTGRGHGSGRRLLATRSHRVPWQCQPQTQSPGTRPELALPMVRQIYRLCSPTPYVLVRRGNGRHPVLRVAWPHTALLVVAQPSLHAGPDSTEHRVLSPCNGATTLVSPPQQGRAGVAEGHRGGGPAHQPSLAGGGLSRRDEKK